MHLRHEFRLDLVLWIDLFRPFAGFRGVVLAPGGLDRLVEFATRAHGEVAVQALQGYVFDQASPAASKLRLRFTKNR